MCVIRFVIALNGVSVRTYNVKLDEHSVAEDFIVLKMSFQFNVQVK